jgi:hypothetical protein
MIDRLARFWPAASLALFGNIAVVIASGLGWNPFGGSWNFANTGAFGDSFGPLNALVATVAAVGAVAAYRAQREELDRVKAAAPLERAEAAKRDFEITFFNLIGLLRETVKEVDVPDAYNKIRSMGATRSREYSRRESAVQPAMTILTRKSSEGPTYDIETISRITSDLSTIF